MPTLAAAALLTLAGCGGAVAPDAPGLLTLDQIAARAASVGGDADRGSRANSELAWRGARLAARAAEIRRAGIGDRDRSQLLRRADLLKRQQG